jgi:hypothetical protein
LYESGDDDGSGDTDVDESDVADTTEANSSVEPVDEIGTGDTDDTGEFGIPILVESSPVIVAVLSLAVVAVIYSRASGSGADNSDETNDGDEPTGSVVVTEGEGLV